MQYLALFLLGGLFVTLTFGADNLGHPDEGPGENHHFDLEWIRYVKTFNKTYRDKEEANYRRLIWEDNLAIITKHNREANEGKQSYFMGVNAFTDWTFDEFSSRYLAVPRKIQTSKMDLKYDLDLQFESSTDTKNWAAEGAVTAVKDQGQCGSCWAFSTTGSTEGQVVIKLKKDLVSLSEQMLVDCCKRCYGCYGGYMTEAFACIKQQGGIDTEQSYPYEGRPLNQQQFRNMTLIDVEDKFRKQALLILKHSYWRGHKTSPTVDGTCRFKPSKIGARVASYNTTSGETSLHSVVQQVGPASVSMYVNNNFKNYQSGIFDDSTCNIGLTNHGVLVVGYGDGYWLVKNSWGTRWGMDGYFEIKRGYQKSIYGMCMIAEDISYPTVY